MKKINKVHFMTGATGFLGANLVQELCSQNDVVFAIRREKSSLDRYKTKKFQPIWIELEQLNFDNFFLQNKIDSIIHCATDYGRKDTSPISIIESNLILPLKILHAARGRVNYFFNTDTLLQKDINSYSLSKHQFKQWLQTYSNGMISVNIALEHFYGPFDDKTKFAMSMIHKIITQEAVINLTEGLQKRDFIFIDDVTSAIATIINAASNFDFGFYEYEVGRGESTSIKDFVNLIVEIAGNTTSKINFGAVPYRTNENMNVVANTEKLKSLGWSPLLTTRQGLERTILIEKEMLGIPSDGVWCKSEIL